MRYYFLILTAWRRIGMNQQNSGGALSSLQKYMSQYDHEHTNRWNKLLHGIGIPIIFVGVILAIFTLWRIGLAFFVGGWIMLFVGHFIEGNKPAFFQGLIYFLVGPVWIAKEIKDALLGHSHRSTVSR
jgi:uncharacterized membrane protein YGL010W